MDSPYSDDLKDDTDLSLHDPTGAGTPGGASARVSSDAYAWSFVVVSVALLWVLGRGFRSVNS